jgi:hypothetical protein
MKVSFKNFKELKNYIDSNDSSKILEGVDDNSVFIDEDGTDVFINAQRKAQKVKKTSNQSGSANDIESRYIWLSKGG